MPYSFMLMLMQVLLLCFLNCCCIKLGEMGVSILFVVLRVARQKRDEFCMSTVSLMIYLTGRQACTCLSEGPKFWLQHLDSH